MNQRRCEFGQISHLFGFKKIEILDVVAILPACSLTCFVEKRKCTDFMGCVLLEVSS